ncbi:MAG: FAD-linked oxidase C-terminal domain-containing protein, partial [Candidatus Bathyarchaeia archaeon]
VPESLNLECKDRFSHMASTQKNRERVVREIQGNEAFMIISMGGDKQVVSTTTSIATKYCKYSGGRETSEEIVNAYWKAKTKLVTELQTGRKYHSADVAVPRGKIQQLYDRYVQTGKKHGLEIYGIRYYIQHPHIDPPTSPTILLDDNNKTERKQYERWNMEISKIGPDLGGTMSSILGVGTRLNKIVEYELGAGVGLMKTIKKAFDPHNLFNPGKKFET